MIVILFLIRKPFFWKNSILGKSPAKIQAKILIIFKLNYQSIRNKQCQVITRNFNNSFIIQKTINIKKKNIIMSRLSKQNYSVSPNSKEYKLWVDSPCSLSFSNNLPYLDKSLRFQYGSIYYKDDPFKPAKKVDQFQKPDLLLLEFRRSIKQAEKKRNTRNQTSSIKATINKNQVLRETSPKQKQIVGRLCPKNPRLLKLQYDKHGNRSSFFVPESDNILKKMKKSVIYIKKTDNLFTESDRIDMSKPENFNPGPGSYFKTYSNISNIFVKRSSQMKRKTQLKTIDTSKIDESSVIGSQTKQRPVLISKTIVN